MKKDDIPNGLIFSLCHYACELPALFLEFEWTVSYYVVAAYASVILGWNVSTAGSITEAWCNVSFVITLVMGFAWKPA